jgi:hypothetical protein
LGVLFAMLLVGWTGWAAADASTPGFVDGAALIDALGDDQVLVEVTLGPTLLKPLFGADPDLREMAGGLESIYALIVDLSDPAVAKRAEAEVRAMEKRLIAKGWERIARVRDDGARILILVRMADGDDERLSGLTVMVIDTGDDEPVLVFANIAGDIDLAALETLGDELDLPGLSGIKLGR